MDEDLGTLTRSGDRWRLTFNRILRHPQAKVWRALTEPEHLRAWFPADVEGERAAGAKLRFPFREDEGPTLDGEMLVYDEPHVLAMRWGDDELRMELEPIDGGCRLTFTSTFEEQGRATRDSAGWHVCLDALVALLDGTDREQGEPWRHFEEVYAERFGPAASTIGPPPGADTGA